MRIEGHTFEEPNTEICVIPRGNKPPIAFIATAVLDFEEFENLCPNPEPPVLIKADGSREFDFANATYLSSISLRSERKMAWLVIHSLKSTPGLKWDTIDFANPKTWVNYKKELRDAKFAAPEVTRIENAVWTANCLNEGRVQEARENFLRGQAEAAKATSGPSTVPHSSQSGDPAKD